MRLDLQRRRVSIAAISVALGVLVASHAAHAQNAEAEALFDDGNRLLSSGKLAQACDAFEASNRAEPRAGTLIRLGECREQNQQIASAWSAYRDALTRVKDPRKRDYAQGKATALEARLSYLTVSVSDESRIESLTITRNGAPFDQALWNRALPVDGGEYVIVGHAPGHEEWQTTARVPAERAKISVEVPKFKELAKLAPSPTPVAVKPAPRPAGTEPRDDEAAPSQGMFTTRRKIALGVAGASVISIAAGVVIGTTAKGKQDDAFKLCPDPAMVCSKAVEANALIQSSHNWALGANIAYGVAAATAIGAGVLWFTGAPKSESAPRVSVVPSLVPGEPGVLVRGSF
jgi:hypothetical protein